ncbi:MAG: cytidylate kinase-like family protein [Lachnospiraceae bacterium]|nr:cytidylate kinase-like family protein [Lachnospiraceae bacterium]
MKQNQKQVIISIGREFGSAGHEIADKISEIFNLPLYDYHLLREIAEEKNVHVGNLEPYDEVPKKGFGSRTVRGHSNSPHENIAYMQFNFLRKKAKEGKSFVVVGRCSEEALKEFHGLITIFVLGDMDKKVERICRLHDITPAKAKALIIEQDKKRKAYHNYFCEKKWGDSRNYDFSINSSKLGVEATTEMIVDYINRRIQDM